MGCDIHGHVQIKRTPDSGWEQVAEVLGDRNYTTFAVLADVRNEHGIKPVSTPKGLPEDGIEHECSEYCGVYDGEQYHDSGFGDHSFTWYDLRELAQAAEWIQEFLCTGVVGRARYERWVGEENRQGTPYPYSSWVGGANVLIAHDMPHYRDWPEGWTYVQTAWTDQVAERTARFREWMAGILETYADAHEIRLVIGFDS